jgi:hypothetical protein
MAAARAAVPAAQFMLQIDKSRVSRPAAFQHPTLDH